MFGHLSFVILQQDTIWKGISDGIMSIIIDIECLLKVNVWLTLLCDGNRLIADLMLDLQKVKGIYGIAYCL